ncbi:uncharacterized protein N7483_004941 [Penicillium malachiteum]|uniref:uncharacterized protein n=1 Tax=Penicillium malachiteum TaxID=1324776 RepID=UPI002547E26C|nr:uncharacterized protein N7483_004941 [Penicillium malachiteum]KAJ5730433.1 hypothetical protein N7483_004941 [Penicillium malachiteum]
MPYIFEIRLKVLEEAKADREMLTAPYKDKELSWDAIQRMENLKGLRSELYEKGDIFEELPNVEAILNEYECGDLQMNGQITYWSRGKKISKKEKFDWDEFKAVNRQHKGYKGFWVEGLPLVLRLGQDLDIKYDPEIEFDFIDDAGCGPIKIYSDDMTLLQGPRVAKGLDSPFPQIMGYECMKTADGSISYILAIMVDVNIYNAPKDDPDRQLMIPSWVPAMALVDRGKSIGPAGPNDRLSGRWMRYSLFTATVPGLSQYLYISSSKTGLTEKDMIHKVDPKDIKPMPLVRTSHISAHRRRMSLENKSNG